MHHSGDAVHHGLERNGDLLLNLLGGNTGPLRDDFDVVVGYVRVSLNGQIVERDDAPDKKHEGQSENQQAIAQREIDDAANHRALPSFLAPPTDNSKPIHARSLSPPETRFRSGRRWLAFGLLLRTYCSTVFCRSSALE